MRREGTEDVAAVGKLVKSLPPIVAGLRRSISVHKIPDLLPGLCQWKDSSQRTGGDADETRDETAAVAGRLCVESECVPMHRDRAR
jgi:hypothetical protein